MLQPFDGSFVPKEQSYHPIQQPCQQQSQTLLMLQPSSSLIVQPMQLQPGQVSQRNFHPGFPDLNQPAFFDYSQHVQLMIPASAPPSFSSLLPHQQHPIQQPQPVLPTAAPAMLPQVSDAQMGTAVMLPTIPGNANTGVGCMLETAVLPLVSDTTSMGSLVGIDAPVENAFMIPQQQYFPQQTHPMVMQPVPQYAPQQRYMFQQLPMTGTQVQPAVSYEMHGGVKCDPGKATRGNTKSYGKRDLGGKSKMHGITKSYGKRDPGAADKPVARKPKIRHPPLSEEEQNEYAMKLNAVADNVLHDAEHNGNWNRGESKKVRDLKRQLHDDFKHWKEERKPFVGRETLDTYLDIASEISKLIAGEGGKRKNRKLKYMVWEFKALLKFLRQDSCVVPKRIESFFNNFEKDSRTCQKHSQKTMKKRALLLRTRLFKNQLRMRFKHFHLTVVKKNDQEKVEGDNADLRCLRGAKVIRSRCKRLASLCSESYKFDEFIYDLIKNNKVQVDTMYTCIDHKTDKKKRKRKTSDHKMNPTKQKKEGEEKPQKVQGLLFYIVCPTEEASEEILRFITRWCEGSTEEERRIRHKLFRKEKSKQESAEDEKKRIDSLIDSSKWTEEQHLWQKNMFHITRALAGDQKEKTSIPTEEPFVPISVQASRGS